MAETFPDTNVGNIDYIRREDAINCIEHMTWYHVNGRGQLVDGATSDTGLYKAKDVYKGLHSVPSADVVQVRHGKWEKIGVWGRVYRCNQCGNFLDFDGVNAGRGSANFCPNCGAKMDGGENG